MFNFVHFIEKGYVAFFAIAEIWPPKSERTSPVLAPFALFFAWQEAPSSRGNENVDPSNLKI